MNNDLNYLRLIQRLWLMRRTTHITSYQADLYFAIVEEASSRRWQNPFQCKNDRLMAMTGMSESSLSAARRALFSMGLIGYKPGIKNLEAPVYKLYERDQDFLADYPTGNCKGNPGKNGNPCNNIGSKLNETETFVPVGTSAAGGDDEQKNAGANPPPQQRSAQEKEKGCAQKEKESPEDHDVTPYWRQLVSVWFEFNRQLKGIEPSFKGKDPRCLKEILQLLKKRADRAGQDWTEGLACHEFKQFLVTAWADEKFLRPKFLLKNLEDQYDAIIAAQSQRQQPGASMPTFGILRTATPTPSARSGRASVYDIMQTERGRSARNPE